MAAKRLAVADPVASECAARAGGGDRLAPLSAAQLTWLADLFVARSRATAPLDTDGGGADDVILGCGLVSASTAARSAERRTPITYISVLSGVFGLCGGVGFCEQALTTPSGPSCTEMLVHG